MNAATEILTLGNTGGDEEDLGAVAVANVTPYWSYMLDWRAGCFSEELTGED